MSDEKPAKAGLLESLSFSMLDQPTLVKRLAHLFVLAEPKLIDAKKRRRDWVVEDKTVTPWLRTVYTPPHGATKPLVKELIPEIIRQKAMQAKRAELVAYRITYGKTPSLHERRNGVAGSLYSIKVRGYRDTVDTQRPSCALLTSYGDWLIAIDTGGYYRDNFLYVRHRFTGRSTLTNLGRPSSTRYNKLPLMLFDMASDSTRAAIFTGASVTFDFDALAFNVGGRLEPIKCGIGSATTEGGTHVTIEIKG
jgi:hypothetical protein